MAQVVYNMEYKVPDTEIMSLSRTMQHFLEISRRDVEGHVTAGLDINIEKPSGTRKVSSRDETNFCD